MNCPVCQNEAVRVCGPGEYDHADGFSARYTGYSASRNAANGHPLIALAQVAFQTFKLLNASKKAKYQCTACHWTFRR